MLHLALNAAYRINDHEDPLDRMLAVLRFTFSKDIKHLVRRFHSHSLPTAIHSFIY